MPKVLKKSYQFLSGIFFMKELIALILALSGLVILGKSDEVLGEYFWLSWALLIMFMFLGYLLFIRGILSFYPRPEFKDDFQTISTCLRGFMSDSDIFIRMKSIVHFGKIPMRLNEDIYLMHEQLQRNPIKIRNVKLRLKYRSFSRALTSLIDHLEEHFFLEGDWYVTKSTSISQDELREIRLQTENLLEKLASSYSSLFSEISHLGGYPFEVHQIYVDDES